MIDPERTDGYTKSGLVPSGRLCSEMSARLELIRSCPQKKPNQLWTSLLRLRRYLIRRVICFFGRARTGLGRAGARCDEGCRGELEIRYCLGMRI